MNELLQKHGCANVFTIPEGLKELMADISREVLRDQPPKIFEYIANYLSVLMVTREHGILAVKILDDLCDCRASVSEHLMQIGMEREEAEALSQIIKEEIEEFVPEEGKEAVKESQILKKVLARMSLDELVAAQVCQVARNAYRDYWYRKKLMEKHMQVRPNEPWELAAQRTLEIYKTTKPSYSELTRATQKIQAAYRGYYVRRNLQRSAKKRARPKVELPGAPLDVAGSREIDLGPVINVQVREEDTAGEFGEVTGQSLHLKYDPMKTITHVTEEPPPPEPLKAKSEMTRRSVIPTKSVTGAPSQMRKSTMAGVAEEPTLDQTPSELPLTDLPAAVEKRKSHFAEPSVDPSRVSSKHTSITSANKISFAEEQKEEVVAVEEQVLAEAPTEEVVEAPQAVEETPQAVEEAPEVVEEAPKADEVEVPAETEAPPEAEAPPAEAEIPEELPAAEPAPAAAPEEAPEVPEELPPEAAPEAYDSAPEADDSAAATDSAPIPSAASSAPVTDVDTGGEEEGE